METPPIGLNLNGHETRTLLCDWLVVCTMSEVEGGKSIFGILGGISLFLGFAFMALSPGIGITCCLFGFFGLAASAISSSSASVNGAEGKMVLKQGTDGQWNWVANSAESNQQIDQAGATQYNDQTNQILSRSSH